MQPALLAFKVPPRSLVVFWHASLGVALARLDLNKVFVESWVLVYGTLFFLAFRFRVILQQMLSKVVLNKSDVPQNIPTRCGAVRDCSL